MSVTMLDAHHFMWAGELCGSVNGRLYHYCGYLRWSRPYATWRDLEIGVAA